MFDELVEIICNYVDVQPADVHEESRFMEDLGFTSFDFMSMLGEIEDTFDVEIEQTKAAEIRTVQEALESDGDSALTLADVIQDGFCMEDSCERQEDARQLRQLLDTLPARERQILLLRYGLAGQPPLTQLETAGLLGISRSYVSRLETHALELLRQAWGKHG